MWRVFELADAMKLSNNDLLDGITNGDFCHRFPSGPVAKAMVDNLEFRNRVLSMSSKFPQYIRDFFAKELGEVWESLSEDHRLIVIEMDPRLFDKAKKSRVLMAERQFSLLRRWVFDNTENTENTEVRNDLLLQIAAVEGEFEAAAVEDPRVNWYNTRVIALRDAIGFNGRFRTQ